MKLENINTRVIYDTRGEETIEADLISDDGLVASASVPSGKSKSSKEPQILKVGSEKLEARSEVVNELKGYNFEDGDNFDETLLKIDGTLDKSNLGANLILAISMAFRRLLAEKQKIPLWRILQAEIKNKNIEIKNENELESPVFLMNLIEGGTHAKNNLSFQEYIVMIDKKDARKNLETGISIYKKVKNLYPNVGLGDENGFSFNFENSTKPLEVLKDIIDELNLSDSVKLGIDAAATNFYSDEKYTFDDKTLDSNEMLGVYDYLSSKFEIGYLEDPFYEDDFAGFAKLKEKAENLIFGVEKSKKNFDFSTFSETIITGDDLTSTNPNFIKQAIEKKSISGVIIKPNQIGTIKETFDAVKIAKENNIKIIISHRSGETNDNFICHLAKASNAWAVKFGAPAKDRIFKYNELLKIY